MKKLFIVFALLLCFVLASCQTENNESKQKTTSVVDNTVADDEDVNVPETQIVIWDENRNEIVNKDIPYYGYMDYYDGAYSHCDVLTQEESRDYENSMYESDDGMFLISDYKDGVCINHYLGKEENVVIPDKINGKKVVKLGGYMQEFDSGDLVFFTAFSTYAIKSVSLPKYLKEIVSGVFGDFARENMFDHTEEGKNYLSNISISEDNPWYSSDNGILYNKDKTILLEIPYNYSEETIVIPYKIKSYAAYDSYADIRIRSKNVKTVKGYKDTAAETFAKENSLEFIALD